VNLAGKPSVTLVLGSSGTGKSTFVTTYLLRSQFSCRFLFDPLGEWSQRLKLPLALSVLDLQTQMLSGWVCYDPSEMWGGSTQDGFEFFCDFVRLSAGRFEGRKVLVVDEIQDYLTTQSMPNSLALIVQAGRKWHLESVFTSQRLNQLNGALLNQATETVVFSLGSDNDLRRLEHQNFVADELAALPDLHFVSRTRRGGELRGVVRVG
jgi:hypothetical protein